MPTADHTAEPLVLRVGDRLVEGWSATPACPHCAGSRIFFLGYDATCCPSCNRWLELLCPDPDCIHCRCRPATPFPEQPGE